MPHRVSALACIVFLSVGCLAQNRQEVGSHTGRNGDNQRPSIETRGAPPQEESISVVRLRVPSKVRELYDDARRAFQKRRYDDAQAMLNQALQWYPAFPEALAMRGYIQIDLNQWELAEQNLQAAVHIDPTYGLGYRLLGDLYNREERFDEAFLASQQAVALTPGSWPDQYEVIRALVGKHQYALALKVSDAALLTNPGTLLHVAKAHALVGLRKYPEAAAELRTYLNYEPAGDGSQDAHDLLDEIRKAMGG